MRSSSAIASSTAAWRRMAEYRYRVIAEIAGAELRERGPRSSRGSSRSRTKLRPEPPRGRRRRHRTPPITVGPGAWRPGPRAFVRRRGARGTAGTPILRVLRGADVSDALAVVTRWFGGTKLGKGGLARAYGGVTREALTASRLGERFVYETFEVTVPYDRLGDVQRLVHPPEVEIVSSDYGEHVRCASGSAAAPGRRHRCARGARHHGRASAGTAGRLPNCRPLFATIGLQHQIADDPSKRGVWNERAERIATATAVRAPASSAGAGGGSSNKTLMLVLSYLWILALVPLLVEKDERGGPVARPSTGLALFVAEVVGSSGSSRLPRRMPLQGRSSSSCFGGGGFDAHLAGDHGAPSGLHRPRPSTASASRFRA